MARCIFCPNELTSDTKPEHILPNALGGRKTTRRVICSACNNRFGGSIDKCLTSQVEVIRNLLQLQSGTGKAPPMLRNIRSGADTVNIRNDGTPELTGKPFSIETRDDGLTTVQITAKSKEQLRKLIPHIAAELRIPVEELNEHLESADVSHVTKPLDTVVFKLSFGGTEALRSITKSCLVLWSTVAGNDEVNSAPYDDARRFVVSGDEDFNKCRIHLDSRYLTCDNNLRARFGDIFNLVYLKSDAAGRLIGHFTMYNAVSWQIVLVEFGAIPDVRVGIASNPLNPAEWSDSVADEFNIDFNWLDNPACDDFKRVRECFCAVAKQLGLPREIGKMIDDVYGRHGISGDDPIPADLWEQTVAEIGDRFAHFALRLPYERSLSPATNRGNGKKGSGLEL